MSTFRLTRLCMTHYANYSDLQLVSLLKVSDHAAFSELYERYWELLFAMAYSRLRDTAQAEDIVHDIFATLWKRRAALRIESPKAWLATAVKYMILRAASRTALLRKYTREQAAALLAGQTPDNELADEQLTRLLAEEINRLPEKCRLVFQLRRQGLTNPEVAAEMNTTVKTVENQVNKGLRALRIALKHYLFSTF